MEERGVETEEGSMMIGRTGEEIEMTKRGKEVEVEREIEEGTEILIMMIEIMGGIGTGIDTGIEDCSASSF